jgi:hypothetical protein
MYADATDAYDASGYCSSTAAAAGPQYLHGILAY